MRNTRRLRWTTVVVGLLIVAAIPLVTSTYYTLILTLAAIYAIVGIGLDILAGYTGQVSLGHAGFYAIGAYVGAWLTTQIGLPFWLAMPIVVVASMAVGALVALPSLQVEGPYLAMVSIAFGIIVHSILVEWSDVTGGTQGILHIPKISVGSFTFSLQTFYWFSLLLVLGGVVLARNLRHSPQGQSFLAVKDNEIGAESLGLSAYRLKTIAFTISAAYAGLAGLLFAHLQGFISPEAFELDTSFFFIIIVILGGLGSIIGPILGAVILTYLPELLQQFQDFRLIIYGSLIVFSLYFMPQGLAGSFSSLFSLLARQFGRPDLVPRQGYASLEELASPDSSSEGLTRSESGITSRGIPQTEAGLLLDIQSVTRAFGEFIAVHNVDLQVAAGSIHALIGPNGAGKTVLLNTICGYYPPTNGEVYFLGQRLTGLPPYAVTRLGIARTFQTTQLFHTMPVVDNVLAGTYQASETTYWDAFLQTERLQREKREHHCVALRLLDFVGCKTDPYAVASGPPFGLRRLVEIARALALQPKLLIMDEPAAGLNPREIEQLMDLISRIREAGITVLLVEHHMEVVMGICDVVSVLDYGEKIAEGIPADIQRDGRVIEAYLGTVE